MTLYNTATFIHSFIHSFKSGMYRSVSSIATILAHHESSLLFKERLKLSSACFRHCVFEQVSVCASFALLYN